MGDIPKKEEKQVW